MCLFYLVTSREDGKRKCQLVFFNTNRILIPNPQEKWLIMAIVSDTPHHYTRIQNN